FFSAAKRRLFSVQTCLGSRSSGQEYRLHRLHSQQKLVPIVLASPIRLKPRLRIALCGSIGWPSSHRGQSSVQKLHWSHALWPIRATCFHVCCRRRITIWSSGNTITPPVVLSTRASWSG